MSEKRDLTPLTGWGWIAAPVLLAAICYAFTLGHGFAFDDREVMIEGRGVKSWRHAGDLFTGDYFILFGENSYRPVVSLTHLIEYPLFGVDRPWGYHLTSTLLHAVNSALVFVLAMMLLKRPLAAAFAACLFAVHPLQAEAVSAISFREDLLCGLFCLLAWLFFELWRRSDERRVALHVVWLVCFALALLSKETAVALPFVLILYDLCFRRRKFAEARPLLLSWVPAFVVLGLYLLVRFVWMRNPVEADLVFRGTTRFGSFLTMAKVQGIYLARLIAPTGLVPIYEPAFVESLWTWPALGGLAAVLMTAVVCVLAYRRSRALTLGLGWYLLLLAPVTWLPVLMSVFVGHFVTGNWMADRFLYVPMIGLAVAAGALVGGAVRGAWRAVPVVVVLLLAALAVNQSAIWRDELTLWRTTIATSPDLALARNDLGLLYEQLDQPAKAYQQYTKAVTLQPRSYTARTTAGMFLAKHGRTDDAIEQLQLALQANSRFVKAHFTLGVIYAMKGDPKRAAMHYQDAVNIDPFFAEAYYGLGNVQAQLGQFDAAAAALARCVEIDPAHHRAHLNLAGVLEELGELEGAIDHFRIFIRLAPHDDPELQRRAAAAQRRVDVLTAQLGPNSRNREGDD